MFTILDIKKSKFYEFLRFHLKYNLTNRKIKNGLKYFKSKTLKVLSNEDTIKVIISQKLSLVRFGDGEMYCMFGEMKNKTSSSNKCYKFVQKKLLLYFREESENLLKCVLFPPFSNHSLNAPRKYIKNLNIYEYIYIKFKKKVECNYDFNQTYGSATVFKFAELNDTRVNLFKLLLKGRNTVIVTSNDGKSIIPIDFLTLSNSVAFVDIPSQNAIQTYDDIIKKCVKFDLNSLFLISGGFAAKILAVDLTKLGFQAIDIGYIPLFKR